MPIILVGAFFLMTIRPGQPWGDDFAQYLNHAQNIANFRPYAATGYIYNPKNAVVGPRAYPPLFPAVLAAVTGVWGFNLTAYKCLGVILFLVTMWISDRLFARDMDSRDCWIVLLVFGLSPVFWSAQGSYNFGASVYSALVRYSARRRSVVWAAENLPKSNFSRGNPRDTDLCRLFNQVHRARASCRHWLPAKY